MKIGKWMFLAVAVMSLTIIGCDKEDEGADSRTNFSDSAFAELASMVNVAEIAASQIIIDSSADSTMMAFAEMMIADHTAAQQQLQTVASQFGLGTSNTLNQEQQELINSMLALKSPALDSLYIYAQVVAHDKAIDIYKNHGGHGLQRNLKFYTYDLLPVLTSHLQQAQTLSLQY